MKELLQKIGIYLKTKGFQKSGNNFYKKMGSALLCAEFQKSQFSDDFYVSIGAYYPTLSKDPKPKPKSYDWHIYNRISNLIDPDSAALPFNLSQNDMASENIASIFENKVLPLLESLADFEYISKNCEALAKNSQFRVQRIRLEDLILHFESLRSMN